MRRKRNEDGGAPLCETNQRNPTLTGMFLSDLKIELPTCEGKATLKIILRKEVIQPQVPLRLPCYDFTPVTDLTVAGCFLAVSAPSSGKTNSHGVTGGVYKARERIHRSELIYDY
jgi:hypothetical protein